MKGKMIHQLKTGDTARIKKTVSEKEVQLYAELTGDSNPLHADKEAGNGIFGKPVVHGTLIAGFISAVLGTKLPGEGSVYVGQNLRFIRPVFFDDTLCITVTVKDINIEQNICHLTTVCTNQSNEIIVTGTATMAPRKE